MGGDLPQVLAEKLTLEWKYNKLLGRWRREAQRAEEFERKFKLENSKATKRKAEIDALKSSVAALELRLKQYQDGASQDTVLAEENELLKRRLEEQGHILGEAREKNLLQASHAEQLEKKVKELEQQLAASQEQQSQRTATIAQLEATVARLEGQLAASSGLTDKYTEAVGLNSRLEAQVAQLEEQLEAVKSTSSDRDAQSAHMDKLRLEIVELEAHLKAAREEGAQAARSQSQIVQLEATIAQLENQLKAARADHAQHDADSVQVERLTRSLEGEQAKNLSLQQEIDALRVSAERNSSQLANTVSLSEFDAVKKLCSDQEERLTASSERLRSKEKTIADLEALVDDHESERRKHAAMLARMSALETEFNAEVEASEAKELENQRLSRKITALEAEIRDLTDQVQAAQTAASSGTVLRSDYEALQRLSGEQEQKIKAQDRRLQDKDAKIVTLEEQIEQLRTETPSPDQYLPRSEYEKLLRANRELQFSVETEQQRVQAKDDQCDRLRTRVEELANENEALAKENQGLRADIQEIDRANQRMRNDSQMMTGQSARDARRAQELELENEDLRRQIRALEDELDALRRRLQLAPDIRPDLLERLLDPVAQQYIDSATGVGPEPHVTTRVVPYDEAVKRADAQQQRLGGRTHSGDLGQHSMNGSMDELDALLGDGKVGGSSYPTGAHMSSPQDGRRGRGGMTGLRAGYGSGLSGPGKGSPGPQSRSLGNGRVGSDGVEVGRGGDGSGSGTSPRSEYDQGYGRPGRSTQPFYGVGEQGVSGPRRAGQSGSDDRTYDPSLGSGSGQYGPIVEAESPYSSTYPGHPHNGRQNPRGFALGDDTDGLGLDGRDSVSPYATDGAFGFPSPAASPTTSTNPSRRNGAGMAPVPTIARQSYQPQTSREVPLRKGQPVQMVAPPRPDGMVEVQVEGVGQGLVPQVCLQPASDPAQSRLLNNLIPSKAVSAMPRDVSQPQRPTQSQFPPGARKEMVAVVNFQPDELEKQGKLQDFNVQPEDLLPLRKGEHVNANVGGVDDGLVMAETADGDMGLVPFRFLRPAEASVRDDPSPALQTFELPVGAAPTLQSVLGGRMQAAPSSQLSQQPRPSQAQPVSTSEVGDPEQVASTRPASVSDPATLRLNRDALDRAVADGTAKKKKGFLSKMLGKPTTKYTFSES
eukprot:m.49271 g.49271  ORF g.49271 m.49271 type:complete len:1166 (+) comp11086_c0_seq3:202-3699(+)